MRRLLVPAALLAPVALLAATPTFAQGQAPPPTIPADAQRLSSHIRGVLASGDGETLETAYKVDSVRDEYQVAAALGLRIKAQTMIGGKFPRDVVDVEDADGRTSKIWFDVSSFYPPS